MILIFTAFVFFSPMWTSVPGGRPAFLDLLFVDSVVMINPLG